ncbi:guanine nucleotide-binding protein subunit beta [Lichtheimia hyalospora FSU 10163]|nr:guanine nucleotide-binding protein subunit beta [Lichtheimia hyalospora FSU 10163]
MHEHESDIAERIAAARREAEALKDRIKLRKEALADATLQGMAKEVVETLPRCNMKAKRTLRGHLAKVYAVGWSNDRRHIVSAAQDGKLIMWDAYSGHKTNAIVLRSSWVMACAYSPSSDLVASGGLDNVCSIHHARDRDARPTRELAGHTGFLSCCSFIDDRQLVTASGDKSLMLWDIDAGVCLEEYKDHSSGVMSVSIHPSNNQIFVSGSCDATAKVWDRRTPKRSVQTFVGHEGDINAVQFFPGGDAFASGSDDMTCMLYDIRADAQLASFQDGSIKDGITSVDFSVSGRLLFSGCNDFNCHVWDILKGERIGLLNGHENRISCLKVAPDGMALCTGSWDATMRIWA